MRYLYCGAWNFRAPVKGVKAFALDDAGIWQEKGIYGEEVGQSILAVAGFHLVAVCEMGTYGKVVSYAIHEDGSLTQADVLEIPGTAKLSYTVAAPDGRHVYVSSMGDGTVRMIRVAEDGKLTLTDEWKLTGHGVTLRQNQAKVHSVMISPDGKWLAAANLGADEVELFRVDEERETLRLVDSKPIDLCKEPRHMAFSPDGEWLYVLTEGGNRLYVFSSHGGKLREYAAYDVLSPDGEQKGAAADIVVNREGTLLYTTNRGQHNIAVWRVLPSGLLDQAGYYPCGGEGPRGLHLSPDGKTLFSANNDDGSVAILPLNVDGMPMACIQRLEVPGAGCARSV